MSDALDVLFADAADEVSRGHVTPPVEQVLARRRRQRGSLGIPPAWVPYAAVASVVLAVVGIAVGPRLLADRAAGPPPLQVSFAGGDPELGTVPYPGPSVLAYQEDIPHVGDPAALLATTTTRLGTARLIGFTGKDGARCQAQYYVEGRSNGSGAKCSPAGRPQPDDVRIELGGQTSGASGEIKDPPLRYGYAPAGTRIVEFTSPGIETVRAPARDAGQAYEHRAYYLTSFPLFVEGTARALTADGRVLATESLRGSTPEIVAIMCDQARSGTRSRLQNAAARGLDYAKDHPESADPARLVRLEPVPGDEPGRTKLDSSVVLERLQRATDALAVMGPAETAEYRKAAVIVVGDGRDCFTPATVEVAASFLTASDPKN